MVNNVRRRQMTVLARPLNGPSGNDGCKHRDDGADDGDCKQFTPIRACYKARRGVVACPPVPQASVPLASLMSTEGPRLEPER